MQKGVRVYLNKKGFIKEDDKITIINNFVEEVLNLKYRNVKNSFYLTSLNFKIFTIYLQKQLKN
jgi:hypothetical protein